MVSSSKQLWATELELPVLALLCRKVAVLFFCSLKLISKNYIVLDAHRCGFAWSVSHLNTERCATCLTCEKYMSKMSILKREMNFPRNIRLKYTCKTQKWNKTSNFVSLCATEMCCRNQTFSWRVVRASQKQEGVLWYRLVENSKNLFAKNTRIAHAEETNAVRSHGEKDDKMFILLSTPALGGVLRLSDGNTMREKTGFHSVWRR